MAKGDAITSGQGAIFIQPGGPNPLHDVHFLKCRDVGDIDETEKALELIQCHDPDGKGWITMGRTEGPPEPVEFSIDELVTGQLSWLEKALCPAGIYLLLERCGRHDMPWNYVRGLVLAHVERLGRSRSAWVQRSESNPSMVSVNLWAYPRPHISDIETLTIVRITTAATDALNDVWINQDFRCLGDCDEAIGLGEYGLAVGDSAVAPALATTLFGTAYGDTWTAAAADPFAAGESIMSCFAIWIDANTRRWLAAMEAPAGAQGMTAYSDDGGATWTTVNVGGAAAGEGAIDSGALFSLDHLHNWLVGANGYIWFSDDGTETWAAQEEGVIHAGNYNSVHFFNEHYGVAVGDADIVAVTSDGGENWEAGTATGGGNDLTCCERLSVDTIIVGDNGGELYCSNDRGVTWTQVTGWVGSGVGDIADIKFVNPAVGYMIHNTAAPVGSVLYTYTGGRHWQVLDTPTNAGLNAIAFADEGFAIAVGEPQGGTAVILKVEPAPAS